ncbi:MAG: hypothetical protein J6Y53_04410 [Alphaproteobacteria bacterium]|nr:hypothetical protein [Alphaproteobacteria bacterium]
MKNFEVGAEGSIERKVNYLISCDYADNSVVVREKLAEMVERGELPSIVEKMGEQNPIFSTPPIRERMQKALQVFPKVLGLLDRGFHPMTVERMLRCTVSESSFIPNELGVKFELKFEKLHSNRYLREEVWGVQDHVTLFLAKSLLYDLAWGVNVESPSEEDLVRSAVIEMAQRFKE